MINAWKKQAIDKLSTIFEHKSDVARTPNAEVEKLHAKNRGARFFSEGLRSLSVDRRRQMIDSDHPSLSIARQCPALDHEVYPYLLRGLVIDRPNQVWAPSCAAADRRRTDPSCALAAGPACGPRRNPRDANAGPSAGRHNTACAYAARQSDASAFKLSPLSPDRW
jgi:hypothetical protein